MDDVVNRFARELADAIAAAVAASPLTPLIPATPLAPSASLDSR